VYQRLLTFGRRRQPTTVNRILVAHHPQMIGDALLLTPLLAKLRSSYPSAEIILLTSPVTAPLYQRKPFGVVAAAYIPGQHQTLRRLMSVGGFDLAIAPGDNRYGLLALALRARWIVGFAGGRHNYKNWAFDVLAACPDTPATWGELSASLISGPAPAPFEPKDWPAPDCGPLPELPERYCVLHIGASTPLKLWPSERWARVAEAMADRGMEVVISGGAADEALANRVDPEQKYFSTVGHLDLPQLWHLLKRAKLIVCPDTSVAHIGRLVGTPTVALFGPGSPTICGAGEYWCNSPFSAVTEPSFPCRDRQALFGRPITWLRRCGRPPSDCVTPGACMEAISIETVLKEIDQLLAEA
jgi:ADP-heptose:LPS heptosyltransferase